MLTIDNVYRASNALKGVIRKTDVIYAPKLAKGADLYLKTENLQITGSFKVRGAYYKMTRLTEEEKNRGVVACSAGNHAQGVALAAQKNGIKAIICLPDGAPISKVEATKSYGAEVCLVEGVYDDAYQKALSLRDEKSRFLSLVGLPDCFVCVAGLQYSLHFTLNFGDYCRKCLINTVFMQ